MKFKDDIEGQGYQSYLEGKLLSDNPWQYTSKMFHQAKWSVGWKKAEKDSNEIYKKAEIENEKSD